VHVPCPPLAQAVWVQGRLPLAGPAHRV